MGQSRRIDWRCDVCGEALRPGDGYATVRDKDIRERQAGERELQRKGEERSRLRGATMHTFAELAAVPPVARWMFRHHRCDPESERDDVFLQIEELSTEAGLLLVTAHLMGKAWLSATNWDDVIRTCGQEGRVG